jgi:hypothetical protein
VVVAKNLFVDANEPYDVKITSAGGLTATLDDAVRVDNSPSWATYVGTLSGTPPVVASIIDNISTATHATLSAVDAESDTIAYTETTSILTTAGMSLASATGIISGTPTDVGGDTNYDFTARATSTGDGGASVKTTDQAFRFTLLNYVAPTGGITSGNPVTIGGVSYNLHAFTSTGTTNFVVSATMSVDILVIAGGGGAGYHSGSGGGAGGLIWQTGRSITAGTYVMTVGTGGASTTSGGTGGGYGANGVDSTFGLTGQAVLLTAKGGGFGTYGFAPAPDGGDGGSGGGGSRGVIPNGDGIQTTGGQAGDSRTYGFGNHGGFISSAAGAPNYPSSGGGGAGGVGQAGSQSAGGTGGAGKDMSALLGTTYGVSGVFAGGGGGSLQYSGNPGGTGGTGGGGAGGASTVAGTSGTANTGGGQGGHSYGSSVGGAGGTGIIIIRYTA